MEKIKDGYDLKHFAKEGQLCFVVFRRYKGKGKPRLILHEAHLTVGEGGGPAFCYGGGSMKHWVVSAGTLAGMCPSPAKAEASRQNGKKGGRPCKPKPLFSAGRSI